MAEQERSSSAQGTGFYAYACDGVIEGVGGGEAFGHSVAERCTGEHTWGMVVGEEAVLERFVSTSTYRYARHAGSHQSAGAQTGQHSQSTVLIFQIGFLLPRDGNALCAPRIRGRAYHSPRGGGLPFYPCERVE